MAVHIENPGKGRPGWVSVVLRHPDFGVFGGGEAGGGKGLNESDPTSARLLANPLIQSNAATEQVVTGVSLNSIEVPAL